MLMKLRLFRVSKGMTIEQFATAIGYERKWYSSIERGIAKPTLRLTYALARTFDMTVADAMELTMEQ